MKLLLASTPITGHLIPLLNLAGITMAQGAEVLVTTSSVLAPRVKAAGARFAPLQGKADMDFTRVEELFPERASLPAGPAQIRFDMERIFIDPIPEQAATLDTLIADFGPDAIITDSMFFGRLPLFYGEPRPRPPIIGLGITFMMLPRLDGAPIGLGLPPARNADERDQYAAIARDVDAALLGPVNANLFATLAGMGVTPPPCGYFEASVLGNDMFMQPTVPSFEYDFGDPPTDVRFVGALPPSSRRFEQPDWWDRLDGSRPIILVSQGTVANRDFDELVNPTIEALAGRDDLHLVVTTGGRPVESVRAEASDNIFVASYVDFAELIPRLAGVVTNGGYGTVSLALQAGVPIIAVGRSEDKAEVGARVAWSGVGIELPAVPPAVDDLRDAVDRLLGEPSLRARAQELASEFRKIDTPREIMAVITEMTSRARPPQTSE
ncbi:glycosyltransferase [Sphingomonas sp.]|uniref:glycosyltransferase n=1 Tax=Sphingomonas sp. TaxID=28214 RepID=UPI002B9951E4|nr:glycosyltransferase [Sphingomonas sp.]HTG39135.1 glycosyltransferase [Sphingomonas sp.]